MESYSKRRGQEGIVEDCLRGRNTPDWVFDNPNGSGTGVQTFSFVDDNRHHGTFGENITIPVFWDTLFLREKMELIKKAGEHFTDNHVAIVGVSCANATSGDWNVPDSPKDVKNWKKIGYTSEQLIQACREIMDATMSAFPKQVVSLAVGRIKGGLDPTPDYVAEQVVAYAKNKYPGRLIVQKNSLGANIPDPTADTDLGNWQIVWNNKLDVAGQMLWFVTNDPTCRMNGGQKPCDAATVLRNAVTKGHAYGMKYMEIFNADILNPDLAEVITFAAESLNNGVKNNFPPIPIR